jgi:pimeloyl-ACP methyl ester carboxylesterase
MQNARGLLANLVATTYCAHLRIGFEPESPRLHRVRVAGHVRSRITVEPGNPDSDLKTRNVRGEFIDVGGARLYYFAAGSRGAGEPVILVHGFPTSSHLWADVVPLVPKGHRVLVVDLLGYGRSDRPASFPLSLTSHAERLVTLMDTLGIRSASVVGHDLGSGVAQALALGWPARVTRLALVDPIAFGVRPGAMIAGGGAGAMSLASRLPAPVLLALLRRRLLRGYVVDSRGAHSIDLYLRPFVEDGGLEALRQHSSALDARETEQLGARLTEVSVPTAIVAGGDDPYLPASAAIRLKSAIPGATLDVIPTMRHFSPEEAPERVAAVIADLLAR